MSKTWTPSINEYLEATGEQRDVLRHQLLIPVFISFLGDVRGLRILDLGCGDGTVINKLQSAGADMVGIDISKEMLQKAAAVAPQVPLIHLDITQPFPGKLPGQPFDGMIANMVFHCIKQFDDIPINLKPLLKKNGWLAFSILHPAFHQSPQQIYSLKQLTREKHTWSFPVDDPYLKQREYRKPIADSAVMVTNYHRPIRDYVNILVKAGFIIDGMEEPLLTGAAGQQPVYYHASIIPRFLLIRARLLHHEKGGDP